MLRLLLLSSKPCCLYTALERNLHPRVCGLKYSPTQAFALHFVSISRLALRLLAAEASSSLHLVSTHHRSE